MRDRRNTEVKQCFVRTYMDWEEGIKDIYQLPDSDLKTGARYNRTMSFHDAGERSTVYNTINCPVGWLVGWLVVLLTRLQGTGLVLLKI